MELTAQDICKIIRACKENAVRHFEYGSIKVSFRASQLVDVGKPSPIPSADKPIPEEIEKSIKEDEEKSRLSDLVLMREAEIADKLVLNPGEFEDLAFSGDLVDGKQPNDQ